MKKFYDLTTNREFNFEDDAIFSIYVRRYNGKRKLVLTTTSVKKAFDYYYSFVVFNVDRKYLEVNMRGEDIPIYSLTGTDERTKNFRGYKHRPNYKKKVLQNVTNIPLSLYSEFSSFIVQHMNESGGILSVNRAVPALMSYFCSLTHEEQQDLLLNAFKDINKHKIISGGDNTETLKKTLRGIIDEDNEVLL